MNELPVHVLEQLLGPPVEILELKHKPDQRYTVRASGKRRWAVVKVYRSNRAPVVAARVRSLSGPTDPAIPGVLHVEPSGHVVVLEWVPGLPLRTALVSGDVNAPHRVGAAIGRWHRGWWGSPPPQLRPHTAARELKLLLDRGAGVGGSLGRAVIEAAPPLADEWPCPTAVHRDLHEEQVVLDRDGRVGMVDLDDAAAGPPELDVGNLIAHLELLGLRGGRSLTNEIDALLDGYATAGPDLDGTRLDRCRRLTLLRLACIHRLPALVDMATGA